MIREDWFPTPIWYKDLNIPDLTIHRICNKWVSKSQNLQSDRVSNVGGWQSPGITLNECDTDEKNLFLEIHNCVQKVCDDFGFKHSLILESFWININRRGDHNTTHIHGGVLSGVFYLQCSGDLSGSLVFHRSSHNYELSQFTRADTSLSFTAVNYAPVKKRLILFPAWIAHSVLPNTTHENRISISFNYRII